MYSVPDLSVSFLLENLNHILQYNYHLVDDDVKDNILVLCQELETLKVVMKGYSKYNDHDDNDDDHKGLLNEIRAVIDEAEDAVDTYVVQAAVQKARSWISKAFHIFDYPKKLRDVGKQIEDVSNKVKKINPDNAKHGYYDIAVNLNLPPKIEEEFVIIDFEDGEAEEVSKLVTQGPPQLEIISIVGLMLGPEKTILAKKVFKDPNVDYEYMIKAFVNVSKEYEKRELFIKILSSFMQISDEVNKMGEEQLEKHLRKQLEGKRYLIVLDDVWEKEDWDRIKDAFPNNKKRCIVLITTRNENVVADHANRTTTFYKLDFLPLDKSRELLRWKVFGENNCPEALHEYEEQILEKCDGLPFAIMVIAGIIWNHRDSVEWWKHVADSVKDYNARDHEQTTKVILELMYKHLPNHLKSCFIYLGIFPEDYEIPVWKLVRLWIAEGLIQPEGDINLEDIAEEYLEELVYRNLVMVGKRRSNDKIKTCRMHDTLRDFCKNKDIEENLFQEINKDNLDFFLSGNTDLDQYRRLCINNVNVLDYISGTTPSGNRVRSFLTFAKKEVTVEPKLVPSIPKTFKLLRVLEIQSLFFTRLPCELYHLVLLKYIAISSNLSSLPLAMSTMWNLQTLIVNTTSLKLEIRADIWNMPQLRHIHTNTSTILPCPDAKKNQEVKVETLIGKDIQTLSMISPESCKRDVFDRTPKLRKLGIRGTLTKLFEVNGEVNGESSLFASIRKLESLENLKLLNDDVTCKLYSLPSEKKFPKQLRKLTLLNTLLDWKEMATLGKLENLEVIKLKNHAFQGTLWQTEKGGFLRLKHLHIGRTDLVVWEASVDNFPKLKCLELKNCDKLKAVPQGLAGIPSLQLVALHRTNPSVASSARRLEILKLEQAQKLSKNSTFKLSVYPPDH